MKYACSHAALLTCFVETQRLNIFLHRAYPTSLVHAGTVWLYESFHFPIVCNKITLGIIHFRVSLCLASPLPLCMCVHTCTLTLTHLPFTHDISSKENRHTFSTSEYCYVQVLPSKCTKYDWSCHLHLLSFSQCPVMSSGFDLSPHQEDFINIFLPVVSLRLWHVS